MPNLSAPKPSQIAPTDIKLSGPVAKGFPKTGLVVVESECTCKSILIMYFRIVYPFYNYYLWTSIII